MRKDKLIQECRYYKGEDKSPYDDSTKSLLWYYERTWVHDIDDNAMHQINIDEMEGAGLADWAAQQELPVTLIALLFNRFAKSCQSMRSAAEPFKKFMSEYYSI